MPFFDIKCEGEEERNILAKQRPHLRKKAPKDEDGTRSPLTYSRRKVVEVCPLLRFFFLFCLVIILCFHRLYFDMHLLCVFMISCLSVIVFQDENRGKSPKIHWVVRTRTQSGPVPTSCNGDIDEIVPFVVDFTFYTCKYAE